MKKFFISMLAVAALAGCAKEETIVADQGTPIGFSTFVENATRADFYSGELALTTFDVYGTVTGTAGTVGIFDGVTVNGTVGSTWTYGDEYAQYWIPNADYDFAAIVNVDNTSKAKLGGVNATASMPTTVVYTTANQNDLLYAEAHVENAAANQGAVDFVFHHLLSKVKFTVSSNAEGGYYHEVTGITVSNFATATYTFDNVISLGLMDGGSWAGATDGNVEFADITEVTQASGAQVNADKLLVPTAASFRVEFTVNLYKGGTLLGTTTYKDGDADTTNNAIEVTTDLVKGNAYNFTINCSVGNPITFTVTQNPQWAGNSNVPVLQ